MAPFSISEIGWQSGIVGEEGQANNITTTYDVLSVDEAIVRWLYFCLKDFDGLSFGVTYSDGTRKPAFETIANLSK